MTTTILLIRHGQTKANVSGYYMGWSDEDLDEVGYHQAHCLSSRLANAPINTIYTSPLKRARTTAALVADPHRLDLNLIDDLTEIQLGDWQGLHADEISRRWPDLWRQSRVDPSELTLPNGESFKQVAERAVRAFKTILSADREKQVAIVTHDVIVRLIVAHILGVSNSIYRRLEINNASLTITRITDSKRQLVTLNDTSHLER